jgi:cation:H+ antiporter
MYDAFAQFSIGIIILISSSFLFIEVGKKLAHFFRISHLTIGVTLIALGTSLPELAVSTAAIYKHEVGLAVANIVGSNIVNILLIFPIGILIGNLRVGTEKTQRNLVVLFLVSLLFMILPFVGISPYLKGLILLISAVFATLTEYYWGVYGRTHEDRKKFLKKKMSPIGVFDIIIAFISLAGIIYGGITTANSALDISIISGYSATAIGLTLTAISTSLPELFFTIISQNQKEEKLTLGNIIGSNIYNLLFIGGLIYMFSGSSYKLSNVEMLFLPIATILFIATAHTYKGFVIPKKVSIVFIALFLLYSKLIEI